MAHTVIIGSGATGLLAAEGLAEARGELFVGPGVEVYGGMIVGERNRTGDLFVNIVKEKKLTNMRSATSDATVILRPPRRHFRSAFR